MNGHHLVAPLQGTESGLQAIRTKIESASIAQKITHLVAVDLGFESD